jgi:hypothetical protein
MIAVFATLSFSHLHVGDRFCGNHRLPKHILQQPPNISYAPLLDRDSWRPIRVVLDLSSFTSGEDSTACKSVGQRVSWGYFSGACTAADVLNESRFSILAQTLANMENYLSRLLKVQPEDSPIKIGRVSDIPTNGSSYNADLVIAVAVRPFSIEDKILGVAFPHSYSGHGGRPYIGGMYLNPAYAPVVPQSELSLERFFFTVVFHEIMHVLGFGTVYDRWLDKSTGKRYSRSITSSYTKDTYSKTFTILHTPAVRRFMLDRFGITEFSPGVPAGIEIEDGGGGGTAGAHPESRIYGSEVMCGIFVGYVWISNLSLSLLDDTGWYEVDYSLGEPYAWGDGRSILSNPLRDFPNEPPQLAFPEHYLCWENTPRWHCNFDYISKGYCSPVADFRCPGSTSDDIAACRMRNFVNPKNLSVRGDVSEFDYLYFKVGNASERCDDVNLNTAERSAEGEEFGVESMCAMSSLSRVNLTEKVPRCYRMGCDAANNLIVQIGNEIRYCGAEGDELVFGGFAGAITCPKPEHICGMKKFLGRPIFRQPLPTEFPEQTAFPIESEFPPSTEVLGPDVNPPATKSPIATVMPASTALPRATVWPLQTSNWAFSALNIGIGIVIGMGIMGLLVWIRGRRRVEVADAIEGHLVEPREPEPKLEIPIQPEVL